MTWMILTLSLLGFIDIGWWGGYDAPAADSGWVQTMDGASGIPPHESGTVSTMDGASGIPPHP
jgi:hypothetical protein